MRAACVAAMLGTVALGQQRVHAVVGSAESGDGFPRDSGRSEKARAFRNYVGLQKRLRGSPKRSGQGLPKGSGRSERATVDYTAEWGAYKEKYGKVYSEQVDRVRFGVFVKNIEYIARENIRGHTYELGVNGYADMTADEFSSAYMRAWEWKRPNATWGDLPHLGTHVYSGAPLSRSVDWTERGAVTKVKNQGKCGSSWAFSTTGALEGAWKIETGKLASFNEQLLVNCDCEKGVCTVDIPPGPVVGFKDVQQDSEESMMEAVSRQPVSVAIKVETSAFQFYKRGVLTACGDGPSHGVLVVGYGTSENGVNYWKVKNSWGPQWGMSGYVRILRGEKRGAGKCGIPSGSPSFPVVEAGPRRPGPGGVAAALLKARAAAAVAALLEDSREPPAPLAPSLGLRRGRPSQPGQLAGAHHAVSEPVIVDDGAPAPPTPSQLASAHHVVSEPIVDDGAPAPPAPLAPSQLDGAHHDVSEPAILDDGATEDKVADDSTEHGRARPNTAELLALIL